MSTTAKSPASTAATKIRPKPVVRSADAAGSSGDQEVDTYDWDTSFAIRFPDANAAVTNGWASVQDDAKNVSATADGYTLTATLGPWQLTLGGDGRNVWMNLPVVSGDLQPPTGATTPLAGATFVAEINLQYVPNSAQQGNHQLMADPDGDATTVRAVTGLDLDPIVDAIVKELANTWLAANLNAFNHVFHDLNLSQDIDTDDTWAFITPTTVSYAVTDSGSLDSSVFGVLTMTAGRPAPATHQVSPNAIPAGSNSGFNISGPIFTDKMLLTGAALQFEQPSSVTSQPAGSPARQAAFDAWVADSFIITNDGMTVTNSSSMTLGNFVDDGGNTRTLQIAATDFKLSVNYSLVEVQFTDLTYNFSPGIDVHINYTQHFTVGLADGKDATGNAIKAFTLNNVDRDCTVSITKSRDVQITQIVTGIAIGIAGAVLGGLAGEAVGALIKGAGQAAAEGAAATADGVAMAIADGSGEVSSSATTMTAEGATTAGLEAAGNTGATMSGFLARVAPKLVGAMIGAGIGGTLAAIPDFVVLAASDDFDKLPSFTLFAERCIQAHNWPGQTGYTLKSAALASSLQVGGDLQW
jgi:hypothetical protein